MRARKTKALIGTSRSQVSAQAVVAGECHLVVETDVEAAGYATRAGGYGHPGAPPPSLPPQLIPKPRAAATTGTRSSPTVRQTAGIIERAVSERTSGIANASSCLKRTKMGYCGHRRQGTEVPELHRCLGHRYVCGGLVCGPF